MGYLAREVIEAANNLGGAAEIIDRKLGRDLISVIESRYLDGRKNLPY